MPALFFAGGVPGGFGLGFRGVIRSGGGGAGAVPRGLAPRAGGGLLRQEFSEVERGLGGGDAHGSVLSGQSGRGRGAAHKDSPPGPPGPSRPPCSEGYRGYAPFVGGKIGGCTSRPRWPILKSSSGSLSGYACFGWTCSRWLA